MQVCLVWLYKACVIEELLDEWLRTKSSVFVTCEADKRKLGLWKVEGVGTSSAYLNNKQYSLMDQKTASVKKAARGAQLRGSQNANLLSHASYTIALERPQRFAQYVAERGLVVAGKGMLGLEAGAASLEEGQTGAAPQTRQEREASLARGRAYFLWQEDLERERLRALGLEPRAFPLHCRNMLITRNADNVLVSIVSHRSLMSGLTAKRLLLPQSHQTCPIPETVEMQVSKL